jgi:hypothetical protein
MLSEWSACLPGARIVHDEVIDPADADALVGHMVRYLGSQWMMPPTKLAKLARAMKGFRRLRTYGEWNRVEKEETESQKVQAEPDRCVVCGEPLVWSQDAFKDVPGRDRPFSVDEAREVYARDGPIALI